jgi:5-formyltetrahydrofolate cyclo-ligase
MQSEKEELRRKYKKLRLAMSRGEVISKSQTICQKLLQENALNSIGSLSIYKPLDKLKEVDTCHFISEVQSKYPAAKISYMGSSKHETLPTQKFDLIIVPVLAFDKDNHRLGWGGSWYDRFLVSQKQALKIGLCFQSGFIEAGLPNEPLDIPLDKIITEL